MRVGDFAHPHVFNLLINNYLRVTKIIRFSRMGRAKYGSDTYNSVAAEKVDTGR